MKNSFHIESFPDTSKRICMVELHKIPLKHAHAFAKFPFWMPATFVFSLSMTTPILIITPDNSALEKYIHQNKSVIAGQPHLQSSYTSSCFYASLTLTKVSLLPIPLHQKQPIEEFGRQSKSVSRKNSLLRK